MTESQIKELRTDIREALRRLDQYLNALPELNRNICLLLDVAQKIAMNSKDIWTPITPLKGNLLAANDILTQEGAAEL